MKRIIAIAIKYLFYAILAIALGYYAYMIREGIKWMLVFILMFICVIGSIAGIGKVCIIVYNWVEKHSKK